MDNNSSNPTHSKSKLCDYILQQNHKILSILVFVDLIILPKNII